MCSEPTRGDLIEGRFRVERVEREGIYAVDVDDGAPVLVHHAWESYERDGFVGRTLAESIARVVAALDHPSIARVRAIAPWVVIDAPPPVEPIATEPTSEDMAACALLMLDVLARLHAAGVPGVSFDRGNARFRKVAGAWRLTLLHPPIAMRGRGRMAPTWYTHEAQADPILRDLAGVAIVLDRINQMDLDHVPGFLGHLVGPWDRPGRLPIAHAGLEALHALLTESRRRRHTPAVLRPIAPGHPRSARALAEAILPFAPRDRRWSDLVDAMPDVTRSAPVRDWDTLIARGEVAAGKRAPWRIPANGLDEHGTDGPPRVNRKVAYPLAAAYHARASAAFLRGDRASARADVDRAIAIDRTVAYLTTRGVLLACEGHAVDAMEAYDAAIAAADPKALALTSVDFEVPASYARAHYCRGCLRVEVGDPRGALEDFDRALQLHDALAGTWLVHHDDVSFAGLAPPRDWIERARAAALRRLAPA